MTVIWFAFFLTICLPRTRANKDIETELNEIRKEIRELRMENQALGIIVKRQENEIRELHVRIENQDPRNDLDKTKGSPSDPNEMSEPSSISNRKRLVGTNSPIAFYAYMSKPEQNPSNHHMVIFDVIKTNVGGGYNGHSGMFTAPVAGIYVFTWTIYTGNHGRCGFGIYVNDNIMGSTFGETDDVAGDYDSDSGTIAVALNAHDDVYIRTLEACTTFIESIRVNTRTTFAGWKLN
ncbi:uncharacterized protein LOC134277974 [Saccostrea cucullata]|uniref:uncharacterized protein LOC134277974 n=1 Tax=Saccostrea cuccullata TaxID=36930 RepID=UPI002ED46470